MILFVDSKTLDVEAQLLMLFYPSGDFFGGV
jgi:hypothetical protein